jgi:hypothetical protein
MHLVRANPELLPTLLGNFEEFETCIAGLVARRTGRTDVDMFCRLAALVATGAVRTALMIQRGGCPRDTTGPAVLPEIDAEVIASSFAALRDVLAADAEH